jgi:CheY-like chemotaxis protein
MRRFWPAVVLLVAALAVLRFLAGEPPKVLTAVLGLAAVALILSIVQGVAIGASEDRRSEMARAQRRLREAAQAPGSAPAAAGSASAPSAPAASAALAPAAPAATATDAADRARALEAESLLTASRSDVEKLRGEIQKLQQRERETEDKLRAATGAATIAAEERKRLDASLKDSRAEVEKLKRELEQARAGVGPAPAVPGGRPSASAGPAAPSTPSAAPRPSAPPPPSRPAAPAVPPLGPPLAPRAPAAPAPPARGPVLDPVAPAAAAAPAPPPPAPRAADGPASGTLLLVDDDADFRTVAALILRRAGYDVLEAPGGAAALEVVRGHSGTIDLLITDMMMPGMSGRQLAQRFTQLRPGVRILYVSGVVDEASAREAIAGENADFLEKPFEGDAFTGKVRELLPAARRT